MSGASARAASPFLSPALLIVTLMLVAPLLLMLRFSLNRYDATELMIETVTLANYLRFVSDPFYLSVMRTTLGVALSATFVCLLLGLPIAYRLARMQSRWKPLWMAAVVLPLFVGNVVRMVGWMILFARGGMVDSITRWATGHGFELMYTPFAVVAGVVSVNLPFVVLTIQSTIETVDSRIEEAAAKLGRLASAELLAGCLAAGFARHGSGGHIVFHLGDERLRHTLPARWPAISNDGAVALLGIQHQQ